MNLFDPSWHKYFMDIARITAVRASCDRAQVGAVIVDEDRYIVATGYNGAPKGVQSCDEAGHSMVDGHCVRAVHAELNAITQAAARGVATKGCAIYCTHLPCLHCTKHILQAGIHQIYYATAYKEDSVESKLARDMIRQGGGVAMQMLEDGRLRVMFPEE